MMMIHKENIHLAFAVMSNILIVGILLNLAQENDKGIILIIFYYPLLILANLIAWIMLNTRKKSAHKIYKLITIGLIALFLPVMIASSFE